VPISAGKHTILMQAFDLSSPPHPEPEAAD
jgi:hypothetical protein